MKSFLSCFIFLMITLLQQPVGFASTTAADSGIAVAKKADNYTIQYLLVFNDNKELLMMKNKLGWHTPVIRSNEPLAIREAMTGLAASIGLTIQDIRLAGLYTHKFEGVPDHPEVCFRSHYTARYVSSGIRQPQQGETTYHWVPVKDCLEKFHFEFLRQQTAPILKDPKKVWGGTFLISWDGDTYKGSKVLEDIYVLSE